MSARRPPWSEFRAALEAQGFRPSRTLGQNFLLDDNMARSIARDAGVGPGALVLEVGAGCGFLSVHLADLDVRLVAVEVDERLLRVARAFLAERPNVRLVHADALAGKHALAPEVARELPVAGDWHLVANLPYSIAGPLLAVLARLPNPPASMTALVQAEVAERVAAAPGERAWGALGARLALGYERALGRRVPAALFWPRPRVESRVVHLARRPDAPRDAALVARYDALVEALFGQRRKQVLAVLAAALGSRPRALAHLERAGIAPAERPERLPVEALLRLAAELDGGPPPPRP